MKRLLPTVALALPALAPLEGAAGKDTGHLVESLTRDEPQAIYSDDPQDSWNRIFHCLFTRTLKVRLSEDFPAGAPFPEDERSDVERLIGRRVGKGTFERIESGDHAVEPLYPHEQFRPDVSAVQLLEEPRFSRMDQALTDALAEPRLRVPLARALMQQDLWAAYDFLARDVSGWILKDAPIALLRQRQEKLRRRIAVLIRKLALTPDEIAALPDNFAGARAAGKVPDLFGPLSEWIEVESVREREHERAAGNRRAARVFVKPAEKSVSKAEFVQGMNRADATKKIAAVALLVRNLLVNSRGEIVPSPITWSVQLRERGGAQPGELPKTTEIELSRRALLENPGSGGLVVFPPDYLSYAPGAGNDYSYAAPINGVPVAIRLATRCAICHTREGGGFFDFATPARSGVPEVRLVASAGDGHARAVAARKMAAESFKKLLADWN